VICLTGNTTINYRRFFHELLEAIPWAILIVDRVLSVSYYNQHAVHLLEATGPLEDLKLDQVIPDAAIIQLVQEGIQTGSSQSREYDKENAGLAWKVSVIPLGYQSNKMQTEQGSKAAARSYHYFVISIEDLTELRRLERVRRDFITNISHELRTPLASVRLLAETLEDAIDTDRESAQTFVEKIEIETRYLTDLVSELLDLSRIESGQVPMMIEPVRAEQIVRETMARMLPQAQRHRVVLRTEIRQGETMVAADSKQISRVFVNLVHNAIKFTPSGGMIIIGTSPGVEGRTQHFFVRDTGVGIRPEELPRIFERFYKGDRARSKADFIGPGGGGSGLGLAIARHVIEAHGGHITAESIVGQGSTFTFTLPVAVQS
jgi:two-component system phosphate regulon sensor histidine kinase PhoR